MQYFRSLVVALLGGMVLLVLAGCGGGGSNNGGGTPINTGPPPQLSTPTGNPSQPGSIGGIVAALQSGTFDLYPNHVTVTLTQINATTGQPVAGWTPQTTYSTRGAFQFTGVPNGSYSLAATFTANGVPLQGALPSVVVHGGLPTLMTYILIGNASKLVTFHGIVSTPSGSPAAGATVSCSVEAPDQNGNPSAVIISTTTASDGTYAMTLPDDGETGYVMDAFSLTSTVTPDVDIVPPMTAANLLESFVLPTTTSTNLVTQTLDIISSTMPAATAAGTAQALVARLAVAKALHASAQRLALLNNLANGHAIKRSVSGGGIVENDLMWPGLPTAVGTGVLGFNVYRSATQDGSYSLIGSAGDPYWNTFSDNDPALTLDPVYYTVASYGANGTTSSPWGKIEAVPMPMISGAAETAPVKNNDTNDTSSVTVQWSQEAGAQDYIVLLYNQEPTVNATPYAPAPHDNLTLTSFQFPQLPPGTYWWAVSAYNNSSAVYATAASYSAFREFTVAP